MTKTPSIRSIDQTLGRARGWLAKLSDQVRPEHVGEVSAMLRSVLHALRDRLPVIPSVRLGAQLPALLRGVYYEGWQPDRGHVHTRTLGEFLAMVDRNMRLDAPIASEDAARAVFRLLSTELEPSELKRVIDALPAPVQELFPHSPARTTNRFVAMC